MEPVSAVVLFILIWWTLLFTVLPWSLKRDERGLPADPHLKRKILQTTLLSAALWLAIYALVWADILSFRDMAEAFVREDELQ